MNIYNQLKYLYDKFVNQIPNYDYILRKAGKGYQDLRDIRSDPHLTSSIQQRKSGVNCLDTMITGQDSFIIKEIEEFIEEIDRTELINKLLECILYGFQPLEIIWEYKDNKIRPIDLLQIKQENFYFTSKNEFYYYGANSTKGLKPPDYKIIMARNEYSEINPYGKALLSSCFWMVHYKYANIKSWVKFADRFAMPLLVGTYERTTTPEESKKVSDLLAEKMEENVIISGNDLKLALESIRGTGGSEIYNKIVNFCNTEISKAILSQTLTTEINIGSYAAANIHYKVKRELIESDIKIVEKYVNQLINFYTELNYGLKHKYKFKIIYNNADNKEQIERDERLIKMGYELPTEYIEKQYGFTEGAIRRGGAKKVGKD
jgi:phage gp29-like protein